jgi:hypothetical protein
VPHELADLREPLRGLLEDELVAARVDLHGAARRDERLHLGHDVRACA